MAPHTLNTHPELPTETELTAFDSFSSDFNNILHKH